MVIKFLEFPSKMPINPPFPPYLRVNVTKILLIVTPSEVHTNQLSLTFLPIYLLIMLGKLSDTSHSVSIFIYNMFISHIQ
jgi:hypothetical protein